MSDVSVSDLAEHTELVAASPLFDSVWYLQNYPDVVLLGQDPLQHYLTLGWRLGRSPSATFNAARYLQLHQDVAAAGINPLLHYLLYGEKEGRLLDVVPVDTSNTVNPHALLDYVQQQLAQSLPAEPLPTSIEQKLRLTQQQLEHYFLRCQSLAHELRQYRKE